MEWREVQKNVYFNNLRFLFFSVFFFLYKVLLLLSKGFIFALEQWRINYGKKDNLNIE